MGTDPILELRNATLFRGNTRVLDRITLTIQSGEHVAVLGPNGAGKSSLIRLLTLDSYPVDPGNGEAPVRVLGRNRWDVCELRKRLGVVSPELQSHFTVGGWTKRVRAIDAVVSGFLASRAVFDHHAVTPEMVALAQDALSRAGATHLAERRLDEMSTGEARRVLIARALVTGPQVIVLDEPTTGLDLVARHRFMERVRAISRTGTTLILVTQLVDEIFPEVGRVVLLDQGRIAADGPTDSVLRGPTLGEVFGAPLLVERVNGYYHVRPA